VTLLFQVTAPHFVAGLVVDAGRVVRAAPILAWTVGKTRDHLRPYFRRKRWEVKYVALPTAGKDVLP
jgi:hypothetical protein